MKILDKEANKSKKIFHNVIDSLRQSKTMMKNNVEKKQ